ncbi:MAG: Crp/Fnr family transcriptional regulator [Clostridiales bacterium]|jgi:CRP/FNR family transcriptional regulator|nr:Crp/Fnr family transcriptional regulator [Eubacteriales bacterium]MDH7566537.1 Crp/Fnr family transcriptional regulator [Clostridiales bacterium]
MKDAEIIKRSSFFFELNEEELQKIADISVERKYKKNMVLFMEGDPGEAFYYIKSGKMKVFRIYEDGKEHILNILGEGDVFGEATLFNGSAYPASAVVYEDAIIGAIKNSDLEKLVKENSELSLKLIKILTRKLLSAQQKVRDMAFNDVFARTASQLIKLSRDFGKKGAAGTEIAIPLSRQELADMVGTTRETMSRVISRFKKEKSIAEEKDRIIILSEDKLKSWT